MGNLLAGPALIALRDAARRTDFHPTTNTCFLRSHPRNLRTFLSESSCKMFSTNPASIFNTWVPLFAVAVLIVNRFNEWCDQALAQRLCQTHRPRHQGTRSYVGHVAANQRNRFSPSWHRAGRRSYAVALSLHSLITRDL